MTDAQLNQKVHFSFWIIGAFALVWNALGGVNFMSQMNPEIVAGLPESHRAIIEGRPIWATGGFAVGVFGGAVAALMLLLRKRIAVPVFLVSLIGVLVTTPHSARIAMSPVHFTAMETFIMVILPVIVAGLLLWYAKSIAAKGLLR